MVTTSGLHSLGGPASQVVVIDSPVAGGEGNVE